MKNYSGKSERRVRERISWKKSFSLCVSGFGGQKGPWDPWACVAGVADILAGVILLYLNWIVYMWKRALTYWSLINWRGQRPQILHIYFFNSQKQSDTLNTKHINLPIIELFIFCSMIVSTKLNFHFFKCNI